MLKIESNNEKILFYLIIKLVELKVLIFNTVKIHISESNHFYAKKTNHNYFC